MNSPRTMRINLLYERLKSANGIRIGDLAREFEVSTKTIARDFRELQNLGAYKVGQLLHLDKNVDKPTQDDLQSNTVKHKILLEKQAKSTLAKCDKSNLVAFVLQDLCLLDCA